MKISKAIKHLKYFSQKISWKIFPSEFTQWKKLGTYLHSWLPHYNQSNHQADWRCWHTVTQHGIVLSSSLVMDAHATLPLKFFKITEYTKLSCHTWKSYCSENVLCMPQQNVTPHPGLLKFSAV